MIAHITTVHSRHDSRIRHKHIPTLKKEFGEEVILWFKMAREMSLIKN